VNSVAALLLLHAAGVRPRAVVMADPGSEWKATEAYRDKVVRPWMAGVGWDDMVIVSRNEELRHRTKGVNFETLAGCCERTLSLPSVAYPPWKKCSLNYKAAPQRWWTERQPWALAAWERGERIAKVIGYDTDEDRRIKPEFGDPDERARYVPWYLVYERGLDREACVSLIKTDARIIILAKTAGLPVVPRKSACTFCANNKLQDWYDLWHDEPEAFAEALEMSRRADATIESHETVGLLRGFAAPGLRSLHRWVAGEYGDNMPPPPGPTSPRSTDDAMADTEPLPCECNQ
jgi:hypothetical protein